MAFRHGRFGEVKVNSIDLSAFCDSLDLNITVADAKIDVFKATWSQELSGIAGATVDIAGDYDPTVTTGPAAVFMGVIQNDSVAVVCYPGGSQVGQVSRTFNAILKSYKESSKTGNQ